MNTSDVQQPITEQPMSSEAFLKHLDSLGIAYKNHTHAPVFTVAESQALRDEIPGAHTKNLFLKDKKGKFFLVTLEEHAEVNLKTIHTLIGASGRVSFGKPDALMEHLGVVPGSVTAFAAINDRELNVKVVLDAPLTDAEIINGHPLENDQTTSISTTDLIQFLKSTDHDPLILKVSE